MTAISLNQPLRPPMAKRRKKGVRGKRRLKQLSPVSFFLLGMVMPVDSVTFVAPLMMDLARYGLAFFIICSSLTLGNRQRSHPALTLVMLCLVASGGLALIKAGVFGGSLITATIAALSPLVAFLVVKPLTHHRWILVGFSVGCTLSALDIIFQFAGMPFIGTPGADNARLSGFSFASTHAAPLFSVALCVVITSWAWHNKRVILRSIMAVILLTGLFLSHGRGGLAGLLLAIVVLGWVYVKSRPLLVATIVAIGIPALHFSGALTALIEFVLRRDTRGSTDITSGRVELNSTAWDAFWKSGVLGVDPQERGLLNPHMAPITSAINIGPVGLVATSIVCLLLVYTILVARPKVPVLFRMIASVSLVTALLEPNGFFVGLTGALLIMLCFAQYGRRDEEGAPEDSVRPHQKGS